MIIDKKNKAKQLKFYHNELKIILNMEEKM